MNLIDFHVTEVLGLAREAGLIFNEDVGPKAAHDLHRARVQRFAELVAAKEREACAQIVEKNAALCVASRELHDVLRGSAAAIRARQLRDKRDRWKEPINPEPRH